MSHGDQVLELPSGFEVSASTEHCPLAAFQKEPFLYGVQFHPEVAHTQFGITILKNFIFGVAKAEVNWNITDYVSEAIREIRETVVKTAGFSVRSVVGWILPLPRCSLTEHWAVAGCSVSTLIRAAAG